MWYLTMYLAGKMHVYDQKGMSFKTWVLLIPISAAALTGEFPSSSQPALMCFFLQVVPVLTRPFHFFQPSVRVAPSVAHHLLEYGTDNPFLGLYLSPAPFSQIDGLPTPRRRHHRRISPGPADRLVLVPPVLPCSRPPSLRQALRSSHPEGGGRPRRHGSAGPANGGEARRCPPADQRKFRTRTQHRQRRTLRQRGSSDCSGRARTRHVDG